MTDLNEANHGLMSDRYFERTHQQKPDAMSAVDTSARRFFVGIGVAVLLGVMLWLTAWTFYKKWTAPKAEQPIHHLHKIYERDVAR